MNYKVSWIMDIEADTPEKAAKKANTWIKRKGIDWCFEVTNLKGETVTIDLGDINHD